MNKYAYKFAAVCTTNEVCTINNFDILFLLHDQCQDNDCKYYILGVSILTRAKRATNRNNVATEK